MIAWLNGQLVALEQARVSIEDRGLLFSDGVFETALLHRGGWFRLREHMLRFRESAAMLRLASPPVDALAGIAHELERANRLADGSFRIVLTRGSGGDPTLLATLRPPDPAWTARAADGWRIITASTTRPSTAAVPAQLKALGRTYALLARAEAADAGADDALLLADDGAVCEGPAWNLFWRAGNTLYTPALELGVLAGVTRAVLLEIARDHGLEPVVGCFPRADLDTAEEIFATMTSVGVVSIRSLDGRTLPDATPAAARLRAAYWRVVERESVRTE